MEGPALAGENERLADFLDLYQDMKCADLAERLPALYAESLYFSDTLKTIYDRDALVAYMQESADRLDFCHVTYHQVLRGDDDYFVRWSMKLGLRLFGRSLKASSIGMTHLRFNAQGQVTLHQDYWDNTEGLLRHFPGFRFLVRKVKQRL